MKYIMFECFWKSVPRKIPIIFPSSIVHQDMAAVCKVALEEQFDQVTVISAGDCVIAEALCSGRSTTLNVSYLEEDSATISFHDYFHGM